MKALKKEVRRKNRKRKKELAQKKEQTMQNLAKYKDGLSKQWYVNIKQVSKWKHMVRGAKDKLKDLKADVKNNDRKFKEMETGLKAKFTAHEIDYMKKAQNKLKKEAKQTAGQKQKDTWDKLKVRDAKNKENKENKIMSKALKVNSKLVSQEKKAESKLHDVKKKERQEVKQDSRKVNSLKLKDDLEKLKQKRAEDKVAVTKARQKRRGNKLKKKTSKLVAAVKAEEAKKLRRMKRRMLKLKAQYDTRERLEKADAQKQAVVQREARDKMVQGIKTEEREMQVKEQKERATAEDQKQKLMRDKDKRKHLKQKLKKERAREKRVQNFLKGKLQKDAHRIEKRAGSRTVAAAERKELKAEKSVIVAKDAALKRATKRARKLAKRKDHLQKLADKYKRRNKHSQFRAYLAKKQARDLKLKYEKMKLKLSMAKKKVKHEEELGEAGGEKEALKGMEMKYKFEVKSNVAAKKQVQMLQANQALRGSKSLKWEAKAQKYKQMIQGALNHARKVATRVRKEWAMKLIKEQDMHTKELMKLKHLMGTRQAQQDAKIVKLHAKADAAERAASKAGNAAGNQEAMSNYIAGLVAEQAVRAKVLRVYMNKSMKIRQKYNKKLGSEWKDEIKRLKKTLRGYKNGRKLTQLKYKIMKLKHKLKESKKQKHIHLEVRRIQNLDIATLLHGAISTAQKGSEKRTAEENRKRVVSAVNAVIAAVMAGDRAKGAKLAAKATQNQMNMAAPQAGTKPDQSLSISSLQATIQKLQQQNTQLKKKVHAGAALAKASRKTKVNTELAHMTKKQRRLWNQLHNLVQASSLPSENLTIKTSKTSPIPAVNAIAAIKTAQIGALQKGVFLPAEAEADEDGV